MYRASIVSANKSIADALNAWKNSETLKSNLSKNEELKVIDLNNSPWLTNAERETLSMQRVIDLTDPNTIDKRKEKAISGLKGLQTADSGFRWFSKTDPSLFITLEVLEDFANLKTLGYLMADAELSEILKKACNYIDAEVIKEIEKYDIKKNQYSGYFNYILIRDRFTEFELPKKIREIKKEVVDFAKKGLEKTIFIKSGRSGYPACRQRLSERSRKNHRITQTKGEKRRFYRLLLGS